MTADTVHSEDDGFARVLRGVLSALLLGVTLVYLPSLSDYSTPKSVLFLILTSVLAAGLLTRMVLQGEVYVVDTPVYYTILAFLAINFISLFQSYNIYQGLQALLVYLFQFVLMVATFHVVTCRKHVVQVLIVLVTTGSVVALIGLLQHTGIYHFHHPWNIPVATIGNTNFVAEYYNVVFPLSVTMLVITRNGWAKIAALMAVFLMTCHLIVLGSRGGWLGAVVTGAVFGGAALLRQVENRRRVFDSVVVLAFVVVLASPVLTVFASAVPTAQGKSLGDLIGRYWEGVVSRSEDALRIQDDSSRQRVLLWEDTLRMVLDRPFVGVGVGNFEVNIAHYLSGESLAVKSRMEEEADKAFMIFRAHNEYLETWSETGIVGLVIFLFLIGQILRACGRLVSGYFRGQHDELAVGLCAAVAATLVHACFSANFQNPASAVHFWVVVGLIWAIDLNHEGRDRVGLLNTGSDPFSFAVMAASGAVVVLMMIYGAMTWLGSSRLMDGRKTYIKKSYPEAIQQLDAAARLLPPRPFAAHELIGKSWYNVEAWDRAVPAFEKSLTYHPHNPGVHYFLGRSLLKQDQNEQALEPMERAVALAPFKVEYLEGYGAALSRTGNLPAALRIFEKALSLDPNSVETLHLMGGSYRKLGRHAKAREVYERALLLEPGDVEVLNSLAVVEVEAENFERAIDIFRELYEAHDDRPDFGLNLAVSYFSAGDSVRAVEVSQAVKAAHPDFEDVNSFLKQVLGVE